MSKLFDKMLNLVGWEAEEELIEEENEEFEETEQPKFMQTGSKKSQPQGKVVNFHSSTQFKLVVMQPESFDDAQDISEHLKNKKPVIVNLESLEKDQAQRIVDFLSGAVYALDGHIQKVSNVIFLIAPYNVDIMGNLKEELTSKGVFPWIK